MAHPAIPPLGRSVPAMLLLPAMLLALATLGCNRHGAPAPAGGSDVRPKNVILQRNVELAAVQQRSLVARVETVGLLEAEGQTDIAAGVSGVVDEVYFREGDEVGPGTILVKIEQTRYESDEELARANVERAKANSELARDLAYRVERVGGGASEEERVKARSALRMAEAELRSSQAAWARANHNLERSRVRAPYAGRINKRMVTKGTYLEEKTAIATIADLSKIRLVGFVPETAAPVLRELLRDQDTRLNLNRIGLPLAGAAAGPLGAAAAAHLVRKDSVLSGYDPEFELLSSPGYTFYARIFFMSTVANPDTHMFEAKAEVLGFVPETPSPLFSYLRSLPKENQRAVVHALSVGWWLGSPSPWLGIAGHAYKNQVEQRRPSLFWPGLTARIRLPLRSNPGALGIPEEAVRASERGFIAFVPTRQTREDGQLEWIARARTLDLGFRADGWVEVRQGLQAGDWIVRRGAEALEDGTPIRFSQTP